MIQRSDTDIPTLHTSTRLRFDSEGGRCPSGPNVPQFGAHQSRRCVGFNTPGKIRNFKLFFIMILLFRTGDNVSLLFPCYSPSIASSLT